MKQCQTCGRSFAKRDVESKDRWANRKFCSNQKCKRYAKVRPMISCIGCKISFRPRSAKIRFCSARCGSVATAKSRRTGGPPIEYTCIKCHTKFKGYRSGPRKYCSHKCHTSGATNPSYRHGLRHTRRYAQIQQKNVRAKRRQADGTFTIEDIQRILIRQHGLCIYCKISIDKKYEIDHIVPLARGGSNWPSNLQLLCSRCNRRKHITSHEIFARKMGLLL